MKKTEPPFKLYTLIAPKNSDDYSVLTKELPTFSDVITALAEAVQDERAHADDISPWASWVVGYAVTSGAVACRYGVDGEIVEFMRVEQFKEQWPVQN